MIEKVLIKEDAIRQILKNVGCQNEIFNKIQSFKKIDHNILRKNLFELIALGYSKIELSKIITQNLNILYLDSSIIENIIKLLKEKINDTEVVKDAIYNNPNILRIDNNIEANLEILKKYEINSKTLESVIQENNNTLDLPEDKMVNSLEILKKIYKTSEKINEVLMLEPILLGIENEEIIKSFGIV